MAFKTKEEIKTYFETGDAPTAAEFSEFIKACFTVLDSASNLPTAASTNLGQKYLVGTTLYTCTLAEGVYSWVATNWGGGVTSYPDLTDKPTINGVTVTGAKTLNDLGITPYNPSSLAELTTITDSAIAYLFVGGVLYRANFANIKAAVLLGSLPTNLVGTAVTGTGTGIIQAVTGSKLNDMYYNSSTADLYICTGTSLWDWVINLKGAVGATGDSIYIGTAVTGTGTGITAAVAGSKAGDYYKNSSTSYFYKATAADTWDYKGSDKGELDVSLLTPLPLPVLDSDMQIIIRDGVAYKANLSGVKTYMNAE